MTSVPAVRLLPRIATVFVVAVLVNYVWEVAQMPLYQREGSWLMQAVHCFVPSLGDGVLVLLILGAGWIVFGNAAWTDRRDKTAIAFMLLTGLAVALAVEWIGLHVLRRWAYAESMPVLPVLDVGLAPVLQMLVLPPMIFSISRWWLRRRSGLSSKGGSDL